jgi:hypothetical protein
MTLRHCAACGRRFTTPQQYRLAYGIVRYFPGGVTSITERAYCRTAGCQDMARHHRAAGIIEQSRE